MTNIMPIHKYKPYLDVALTNRQWPNQRITKSPIWCSVDLRDGNQALVEPMGIERKMRMFKKLCAIGYKEIEIGFPSASQPDYDFTRHLLQQKAIPNDVWVQVLTQCRSHLIEKTFASLKSYPRAIVHFYNSTSTLQRQVVFKMSKAEVKKIAVDAAITIKQLAEENSETDFRFEYSPESFTQTELNYALEVCEAVIEVIKPTAEKPMIINLPATVEIASPNNYADMIEWMHQHFNNRQAIILSLHPHNDRGTAIAAAELGLMAGADRIEGTLFGNGERTGNVDLVTLGMNLVSQGVDAGIDFSDMRSLIQTAEYCNRMPVPDRHPYAGALVFTAFSGSHQDAINKGLKALTEKNSNEWAVPYLPIDPNDIGASYEAVIRINSQSGKGGMAFVMENDYGMKLPRRLQIEFSGQVQQLSESKESLDKGEVEPEEIFQLFSKEYLGLTEPYQWVSYQIIDIKNNQPIYQFRIKKHGELIEWQGMGESILLAFLTCLNQDFQKQQKTELDVVDYTEHALGAGAKATAITYIECRLKLKGNGKTNIPKTWFGVGMDPSIDISSLKAILSAANRFASGRILS